MARPSGNAAPSKHPDESTPLVTSPHHDETRTGFLSPFASGWPGSPRPARPSSCDRRATTTARSHSATSATSGSPGRTGSGIVRLTVNKARDLTPRFSPDGKTIAFSSDREGGLDVYLIPSIGGEVKRLTQHSADDTVLGWSPDGKSVLFASQRGEDFMGKLYTVSIDGGASRNAGPDMGTAGSYSPDGTKLAINRKAQSYWRKYYRGAYQSDVTVMDLAAKTFKDLTEFDGMDSWPMWSNDGRIYFVSDRDANSQANIWFVPESGGDAVKVTDFKDGDVRFPSISADGKTIVFERDFGISKLDLATKTVTPLHFDIAAETQESLTEFRDFNSTVNDYDVAPNGQRIAFAVHGRIFTAPTDENGELRQITDGPVRDQDIAYSPDGKFLAFVSDKIGPRGDLRHQPRRLGRARRRSPTSTP